MLTESDLHGNTLTFEPNGIFSKATRAPPAAVTFVRDSQNRITEIIDPDQNPIYYNYNTAGDLVSVADRDENFTNFAYSPAQPHFLDQITDGLGNVVMTDQYNTSGRLTQFTNATGSSETMSYNLSNLSESATAPGNTNPTTNTYSTEGLLVKSVDADGIETDYTYTGIFLTSELRSSIDGSDLVTTYVNNAYGQPIDRDAIPQAT